jgi:hypothetical protein
VGDLCLERCFHGSYASVNFLERSPHLPIGNANVAALVELGLRRPSDLSRIIPPDRIAGAEADLLALMIRIILLQPQQTTELVYRVLHDNLHLRIRKVRIFRPAAAAVATGFSKPEFHCLPLNPHFRFELHL